MSLVKVIKGLLKLKEEDIDWMYDSPEQIRAKAAFNSALVVIGEFLESYEKGTIPEEYKNSLIDLVERK